MIEIKSRFRGWIPATKEQALKYAKHIYSGAVGIKSNEKTEYINANYLREISFSEGELHG